MRNWDYRYCWLRDATFTLYALMAGGYGAEAKAWRRWLSDTVAGVPDDLQIMYGITGQRRLPEVEIPWLPGYENLGPVRTGNAAYTQRQLYGELLDCLHSARRLGLPGSPQAWRIQRGLADFLCRHWEEPDKGIWEVRGPDRQFTHSKVMAWVAFDRAVKSVEQFGETGGDVRGWRRARENLRREILAGGYNPRLNAFTQSYGSDRADASLLMLPMVGFVAATDPRMTGTVDLVRRQLERDGLVRRYPQGEGSDGLPGGEGAFIVCSFWLADNLALQGRKPEARDIFERVISLRNDVGLLSEEYDLARHRLVGNFPQAVNTACNLTGASGPAHHRGR